jgi:hypothetical protein
VSYKVCEFNSNKCIFAYKLRISQLLDKNKIIQRLSNQDFVKATVRQLIKEFYKIGVDLPLNESMLTKEEILTELSAELSAIIDQRPQLLAQLFYSIDLSEDKVNKAMNFDENISDNIAELILVRAAQKVYIREVLS